MRRLLELPPSDSGGRLPVEFGVKAAGIPQSGLRYLFFTDFALLPPFSLFSWEEFLQQPLYEPASHCSASKPS